LNTFLTKFTYQIYKETVLESRINTQKQAIVKAIGEGIIEIIKPQTDYLFKRKLDEGEKAVLNLAFDLKAELLIIDEREARNEAKELGFVVSFTSAILKAAEKRGLIKSYSEITSQLRTMKIYLPT